MEPQKPAFRRRARKRAASPARIVAYDFETGPIRSGTPRPLYLTAAGDDWRYASPIRSMAHLHDDLVAHFLTEENAGTTFAAWNAAGEVPNRRGSLPTSFSETSRTYR